MRESPVFVREALTLSRTNKNGNAFCREKLQSSEGSHPFIRAALATAKMRAQAMNVRMMRGGHRDKNDIRSPLAATKMAARPIK